MEWQKPIKSDRAEGLRWFEQVENAARGALGGVRFAEPMANLSQINAQAGEASFVIQEFNDLGGKAWSRKPLLQ